MVVIDVIRATTTIAHALAAGAKEVCAFASLDAARAARETFAGDALLAGERGCHRPEGFDLGNSPAEMTPQRVAGRVIFMTTTNGTRAIAAAFEAATTSPSLACYTAAMVNVSATAQRLAQDGRDVLLLCAGSDGELAEEDLISAGAMLRALREVQAVRVNEDYGAADWFDRFQRQGPELLAETRGGRKLVAAGLAGDLAACAARDTLDVVCRVDAGQRIRREL